MTTPQYIKPSAKIALEFSALEQKLLLDDMMFLNDGYAQIIRNTPIGKPIQLTLGEWDDLGRSIADEASHIWNKTLRRQLDAIIEKIQHLLDNYTIERLPPELKVFRPEDESA